jgi:hypothetical protein
MIGRNCLVGETLGMEEKRAAGGEEVKLMRLLWKHMSLGRAPFSAHEDTQPVPEESPAVRGLASSISAVTEAQDKTIWERSV